MNHQEVVMPRFSPEEQTEVWERLASGQSMRSIAIGLGRYTSSVRQLVMRTGGVAPGAGESTEFSLPQFGRT